MADLKAPRGGGKGPSQPRSFLAGQGWKWLSFLLVLVLLDLLIVFKFRRVATPESPEWLDRMNRGLAYLEQFNYEPATHQYEQALAIKPKDVATRINLAIALLNQAKPETLDKAVELLRGVLALRELLPGDHPAVSQRCGGGPAPFRGHREGIPG